MTINETRGEEVYNINANVDIKLAYPILSELDHCSATVAVNSLWLYIAWLKRNRFQLRQFMLVVNKST